jgi:hypothetical protein
MTVLEAFRELGLPTSPQVLSVFGLRVAAMYRYAVLEKKQYENGEWITVRDYSNAVELKNIIMHLAQHVTFQKESPEYQFYQSRKIRR